MKEKTTDRRAKYSRMVIEKSFIQLLEIKPISKITIKEICAGADVNRATFYAHYLDQDDLLHQIENDLIDDVNQYLNSYDPQSMMGAPVEMLEKILEYVKANAQLFDLLLNANGDIQFQQEIIKILGQRQLLPQAISEAISKEDAEYVFLFFAHGCIGVVKQWLTDGMKKPANETAELVLRIMIKGRKAFIEQ